MPDGGINFIIYLSIGVLPCIAWLLFYLRQDVHPESNKKVIEVFLWGAMMVAPVILFESFWGSFFPEEKILLENTFWLFVYYIFAVGLTEEGFKYLTVKIRVLNDSNFDEPIDAMLYMIIAGLGFAAVENIILIVTEETIAGAAMISGLRLFSAVFLHALAAAITGYFLALSLFRRQKERKKIQLIGLFLSSLLHGIYDVSITKLDANQDPFYFILPIVIILFMAIMVHFFFLKVKKLPRGCRM